MNLILEHRVAYFYSLMGHGELKRKRPCLCCSRPFNSLHNGNRICSTCAARNARTGKLKALMLNW